MKEDRVASMKCAKPSLCQLTRTYLGKFPSSPVVKTLGFYCRGLGSNHWSGNRSHVSQGKKKKNRKQNRSNIVTNSIKT